MSSGWSATSKKNVSHIYMQKYQECLAVSTLSSQITHRTDLYQIKVVLNHKCIETSLVS